MATVSMPSMKVKQIAIDYMQIVITLARLLASIFFVEYFVDGFDRT